jgi:tellurite resistance protein
VVATTSKHHFGSNFRSTELSGDYEDQDDYEPDSPEAILRCAVAVACCDGEFAYDERDRVRGVYADICQEMTFAYNKPEVSDDYEDIAQVTAEYVLSLKDNQAKANFVEHCGQFISDKDLREMTLVMALRIAGGDAELDEAEFQALQRLANLWQIRLKEVLEPYLT